MLQSNTTVLLVTIVTGLGNTRGSGHLDLLTPCLLSIFGLPSETKKHRLPRLIHFMEQANNRIPISTVFLRFLATEKDLLPSPRSLSVEPMEAKGCSSAYIKLIAGLRKQASCCRSQEPAVRNRCSMRSFFFHAIAIFITTGFKLISVIH